MTGSREKARMEKPRLGREYEIFSEAIEREPSERRVFVRERAGSDEKLENRILALIAGHERAERDETVGAVGDAMRPVMPDAIGGYRVLSRLGEGGMGVVYAAEQARPIRRRVAVKVLKAGFDSSEVLARFDAERQALALMNHANIAQILDAGVNEGRPYFVMELIAGVPITEYCDRRRLSIEERLKLFLSVCDGVQHAHQKGIIHRDLKPSNVLVAEQGTDPMPKIIDFGIAKAVTNHLFEATIHTEIGRLIGTPDYMSPEQANTSALDIDTRTDVYSLGALLYELLCGTTVFGLYERSVGLDEIRMTIAQATPVRPSERLLREKAKARDRASCRGTTPEALARVLGRDLDWIVHKALEKDRVRRYASASELAGDVSRYLRGEAVVARPPSVMYRTSTFARRHKAGVVAGAVVAMAIVAASVVSVRYAVIAQRERDEAQARADQLARISAFEAERQGAIVPRALGADIRRAIIEGAPEEKRAAIEAELVGTNFTTVALRAIGDELFANTIDSIEESFPEDPLIRATLLHSTASNMASLGLVEQAVAPQLRALAIRRDELGPEDPETIDSIINAAGLFKLLGRFAEAEPLYVEVEQTLLKTLGTDDERYLRFANEYGLFLQETARYDEAEAMQVKALEGSRRIRGKSHPKTLKCMNDLGYLYYAMGDYDKAKKTLEGALALSREVLEPEDPQLLSTLTNMGGTLVRLGDLEGAVPLFEESLVGFRAVHGDDHPDTITMVSNTGYLLQELGRLEEAEGYYRQSLESRRKYLSPEHPDTLTSEVNLANLFIESDRSAEAEPLLRHVVEIRSRDLAEGHPRTLNAVANLSTVLRRLDRLDESLALTSEAAMLAQRDLPKGHAMIPSVISQHARTLFAMERFKEASEAAIRTFDTRVETYGPHHSTVANDAEFVAQVYEGWDQAEPGAGHDAEAARWRERASQAEKP